MKSSNFRIVPLPTEIADAARRAVTTGAPDHALVTAQSAGSCPCRHCLRWAQPGERVILFPYAAIPSGYSYSETGPIFVHAKNCQRLTNTRLTFAMAACFALTIQITASSMRGSWTAENRNL